MALVLFTRQFYSPDWGQLMAATLQVYSYLTALVDGVLEEFGSLTSPNSVSLTGNVRKIKATVGTTTTKTLYESSTDLPATFSLALIACDFDVYLEQIADNDGSIGDEAFAQLLRGSGVANKWGIPFIIPKQAAYANYSKNFAGGTVDVITTIRCRNLSSSQIAECLLLLFL